MVAALYDWRDLLELGSVVTMSVLMFWLVMQIPAPGVKIPSKSPQEDNAPTEVA